MMGNEIEQTDPYDPQYYKSLSGDAAIQARLQGRLPMIEIAGHPFFVEVRLNHLRPKDNFLSPGIDLTEAYFDEKKKQFHFYYHIPSMSQAIIRHDITEFPKDVVMIKIPDMYKLDPVSMARIEGKEPTVYLKKYPLIMYWKAEVIPVEKTYLATMIKENLKIRPKKTGKPRTARNDNNNKGLRL